MSRSYIVIPEGTAILVAYASSPHYAGRKATRGLVDYVETTELLCVPVSATIVPRTRQTYIPGQLTFEETQ